MIAVLICLISVAALAQFFVFYCRSHILACRDVPLTAQVRELAGLETSHLAGDAYARLAQLAELCPHHKSGRMEVDAVNSYYRLVSFLQGTTRSMMPAITAWTERERENCSHFIAVILGRRIDHNRQLLAQQMIPGS